MLKTFSLRLIVLFVLGLFASGMLVISGITPSGSTPLDYKIPTLTFHLIASSEDGVVLGGTLAGPEDNMASRVELVVQFYKTGYIFKTETFDIDVLSWPQTSFQLPAPNGVECYEIIAMRTFDYYGNVVPSVDETVKYLKPGRCRS